MICKICNTRNSKRAVFCRNCSSPINVVGISGLGKSDLEYSIFSLFGVLSDKYRKWSRGKYPRARNKFFRSYLNLLWLRPENALYAAIMADLVDGAGMEPPILDLGCGDGTTTTILRGGKFDERFDTTMLADCGKKDIYDFYRRGAIRRYVVRPGRIVDVGLDIKPNLLRKARETGTYGKTILADGQNLSYFGEKSFNTVWTNVIKDFEHIDGPIKEIRRVLRGKGRLITLLPSENFIGSLYYYPRISRAKSPQLQAMYARLNRGRAEYNRHRHSPEEWSGIFKRCGMRMKSARYLFSPDFMKLWDTGLRPFSTRLAEFAQVLDRLESKMAVKRETVGLYERYLQMYLDSDCAYTGKRDGAFLLVEAVRG